MNEELEKRHEDMVKTLAKAGKEIVTGLSYTSAHNLHMVVGIVGEVAELAEALLSTNREHVIEEIGDLEFYITGLKQGIGIEIPSGEWHGSDNALITPLAEVIIRLGISSGFLLDAVKKEAIYNKPLDLNEAVTHLAVVGGCVKRIYSLRGITREECLEANYNKLGERYKNHQYSDEQAQQRNDKTGESQN